MFPRFISSGPAPKCHQCGGTGKISYGGIWQRCDRCNGTGVEGDPRWLIGCVAVYLIALIAVATYFIN